MPSLPFRVIALMTVLGFGAGGNAVGAIPFTLASYRDALAVVERGVAALGGVEAIERAGGLVVVMEGSQDLSGRMQGRHPDRPEPTPLSEALVLDTRNGRMAWESRGWRSPDAQVHRRLLFEGGRPVLALDLVNRRARWGSPVEAGAALDDYRHAVPHYLLASALANRASLRRLPGEVGRAAVSFTLATGETLSLGFDPVTGLPEFVEYLLDVPLLGDQPVRWNWDGWQEVPGLGPYPTGHTVGLGDDVLVKLIYRRVQAGAARGSDWLTVPGDIQVPEPDATASREAGADAAAVEIAEGVWQLEGLAGGFQPMVVEFRDFLVAVDAPAPDYAFGRLPARSATAGESSSSISVEFLERVRRLVPDKPVKYVVLTHWHGDHAGGARVFLAAGATVVATETTASVVSAAARRHFTLQPDPWSGRMLSGAIDVIDGRHIITDGQRELHLVDVGDNPHASGMLVAWLPKERILFQSDLFEPLPEPAFPSLENVPVMRWFAGWLAGSGLEPDTILAMRGTGRVRPEQMARIRVLD